MLHRVLAGVILTIALAFACLALPAQERSSSSRKPAPDFTLENSNGALLQLSSYKGKVVLLDFWATWCHGCKTEIPWFIEFQSKYGSGGLAVIGVSLDGVGWKVVKPFVKEKKLNYSVVLGNDDVAKLYGIGPMPVSLLIDRDGNIADSHSGVVDRIAWEKEIRSLLHEPADTTIK